MTLAELAALAAKVDGFVRPSFDCRWCGGTGEQYGTVVGGYKDNEGAPPRGMACRCLAPAWAPGPYREWDDSPAALAMAVLVCSAKGRDVMLLSGYRASIAREVGPGLSGKARHDGTPEGIARALLTALLRAHGVEVGDE